MTSVYIKWDHPISISHNNRASDKKDVKKNIRSSIPKKFNPKVNVTDSSADHLLRPGRGGLAKPAAGLRFEELGFDVESEEDPSSDLM
jgi:hypothetical protein